MIRVIKQYGVSILLLIVAIFCIFNIGQNIQDAFTVITNSLAIFLAIFYFVNFERNIIIKIKSFVLNIKWPFHGKTKKILTNVLNFIIEKRWDIISYLFIFLLLIITLGQFSFLEKFINLSWINKYQVILTVLAILSGGLTFWHNRGRVEREIENEQIDEQRIEDKKRAEFSSKFPKINKIPIFRNLVKWMYKEGWIYSLSLVVITSHGLILRLFHAGKQSLWIDEIYSFNAINAILHKGIPILDSGFIYYREIVYSYLVSFFIIMFGQSEIILRLCSILFGTISIILIYFLLKKIYSKQTAIFGSFLFSILHAQIVYSRLSRFYIFNEFLFIIFLSIFFSIIDTKKVNTKLYLFLAIASLLLLVTSNTNIVLIGPMFCLLLFLKIPFTSILLYIKKYKYQIALLSFVIITYFYFYFNINRILLMINFNDENITYLLKFILLSPPFFIFLLISATLSLYYKKFRFTTILLFINLIVVACIYPVFFDRYIFTFFWVLSIILICLGIQALKPKKHFFLYLLLIIVFSNILIFIPRDKYYIDINRISQPDYKKAYELIYLKYNPNDYIISVSSGSLPSYYIKNLSCDKTFLFYNTNDSKLDSYKDWADTSLMLWSYQDGDTTRDIYNSCEIIKSKNEFQSKFIKDNSIGKYWFVVDKKEYLDPSLQDFVYKFCEKTEFYQIYVYSCEKKQLFNFIAPK
jgi:hypothetical protein